MVKPSSGSQLAMAVLLQAVFVAALAMLAPMQAVSALGNITPSQQLQMEEMLYEYNDFSSSAPGWYGGTVTSGSYTFTLSSTWATDRIIFTKAISGMSVYARIKFDYYVARDTGTAGYLLVVFMNSSGSFTIANITFAQNSTMSFNGTIEFYAYLTANSNVTITYYMPIYGTRTLSVDNYYQYHYGFMKETESFSGSVPVRWSGGDGIVSGAYSKTVSSGAIVMSCKMPTADMDGSVFHSFTSKLSLTCSASSAQTWYVTINSTSHGTLYSYGRVNVASFSITLYPNFVTADEEIYIYFWASGSYTSATLAVDDVVIMSSLNPWSLPHFLVRIYYEYSPFQYYTGAVTISTIAGSVAYSCSAVNQTVVVPYNGNEYLQFWLNGTIHRKIARPLDMNLSSYVLPVYVNSPSALYQATFIVLDFTGKWSSQNGAWLEIYSSDGTKLIHSDFLDVTGYVTTMPSYGYQYKVYVKLPSESYYAGVVQAIYSPIEIPINVYDTGVVVVPIKNPSSINIGASINWTQQFQNASAYQFPPAGAEAAKQMASGEWGRTMLLLLPLFFMLITGRHYSAYSGLIACSISAMINAAVGFEFYSTLGLTLIATVCIFMIIVTKGRGGS